MRAAPKIPTPVTVGPIEGAIPRPEVAPIAAPAKAEAPKSTPSKETSTKQEINKALQESAQMLLDLKDTRVALAALARQAGAEGADMTPMGAELRSGVIQNLLKDETLKGPAIETLKSLNSPANPETRAMEKFLIEHIRELSPEVVNRLQLELQAGRMTAGDFSEMMQSYVPVRDAYFTAVLGPDAKPPTSPETVLSAAGLPPNETNLLALKETFKPEAVMKPRSGIDKSLAIGLTFMIMTTGLQMLQQDAAPPQRGGHG